MGLTSLSRGVVSGLDLTQRLFYCGVSIKKNKMADIRTLPISLAKLAAEELNEVPERIFSDIEALRNWINQSPHLKSRMDDQFLVAFLRGCKYSLEKAKHKIDLFYTVRTHAPELIKNRDPMNDHVRGMIRLG